MVRCRQSQISTRSPRLRCRGAAEGGGGVIARFRDAAGGSGVREQRGTAVSDPS